MGHHFPWRTVSHNQMGTSLSWKKTKGWLWYTIYHHLDDRSFNQPTRGNMINLTVPFVFVSIKDVHSLCA